MSAPRQQRGRSSRGSIPFRTQGSVSNWSYTLDSAAGFIVNIAIDGNLGRASLNGLPEFRRSDTGAFEVEATIVGNVLSLRYEDPVTGGITFELGARDPALRGPMGEFLAPGSVTSPTLTPFPTVSYFGAFGTIVENSVNLPTVDGAGATVLAATMTGSILVIAVPPNFALPSAISGPISPGSIGPGETLNYRWDVSEWTA